MADEEFTPEQFAEQIRQLKVADILLSTVSTLGQLSYVKLDAKQLDEARLAIDAMAALLPALEGHTEPQTLRDFNQLLANVRLSFASAAVPEEPSTDTRPSPSSNVPRRRLVPGEPPESSRCTPTFVRAGDR